MADKRDSSRQRRAKDNRASRQALNARKQAAARKADEPTPASTAGKRAAATEATATEAKPTARTRAQGSSVRARPARPPRPGASARSAGRQRTPQDYAPIEPEGDTWFQKVDSIPGGRFVLFGLVLTILAAVAGLFMSHSFPLDRDDTKLKDFSISKCVRADKPTSAVKIAKGESKQSTCGFTTEPGPTYDQDGPKGATKKQRDAAKKAYDKRVQASVNASLTDFFGWRGALFMAPPVLAAAIAVAFALKPYRRRAWFYAAVFYGLFLFMLFALAPLFVLGFVPFAWGVYKAYRAEGPLPRQQRPTRGQRASRDEADEDDDVVDVDGDEVADRS